MELTTMFFLLSKTISFSKKRTITMKMLFQNLKVLEELVVRPFLQMCRHHPQALREIRHLQELKRRALSQARKKRNAPFGRDFVFFSLVR